MEEKSTASAGESGEYVAPAVEVLGGVEDLTSGGSGPNSDGFGGVLPPY